MKISIGCDHGALALKNKLVAHLEASGHEVMDFGTHTGDSCDYPVHTGAAARAVAEGLCQRGIVLCTTGIGASIAANKVRGIRCALLHDRETARITRLHNDTNVLALGAAAVDEATALDITDIWLSTDFSGDARHQRRIDQVMALEDTACSAIPKEN